MERDFSSLKLNENDFKYWLRDISNFSAFKTIDGSKQKLKDLSKIFINGNIQSGYHSNVINSRVTMALYRAYQLEIENEYEISSLLVEMNQRLI